MKTGIEPPHLNVAFFFDRARPLEALSAVFRSMFDLDASPTGELQVVRSNSLPAFSYVSDLAASLSLISEPPGKKQDWDEWADFEGRLRQGQCTMRSFLNNRSLGPLSVSFGAVEEPASIGQIHPIEITISGVALELDGIDIGKKELKKAARFTASFAKAALKDVCEEHDPQYASILFDRPLPTPRQLINAKGSIGTEIFVSNRLEKSSPGLMNDLEQVFPYGAMEIWKCGHFFSGWSPFSNTGVTLAEPRAATQAASLRLGKALASSGQSISHG